MDENILKQKILGRMRIKNKRLTVSLDKKSYNTLMNLSKTEDVSMGEIIRRSLNFYSRYRKVDPQKLDIYLKLLTPGDHLIVDRDWIKTVFDEIDGFSEDYLTKLKRISEEHGKYFYKKYKEDLEGLIKYFDTLNWIKFSEIDDGYVLFSDIPKVKETLKIILEIVMPILNVNDFFIEESENKLFIRKKRV